MCDACVSGDPPGSLSEDGVMCDACVYRALSVLRVPLVVLCSACLVGLCADACVSAESLGFLAPGVEERVTVPRLDRRPCVGRWQGAPLLFLSATVPLLVRLDGCLCALLLPARAVPIRYVGSMSGVGINTLKKLAPVETSGLLGPEWGFRL